MGFAIPVGFEALKSQDFCERIYESILDNESLQRRIELWGQKSGASTILVEKIV